MAYCTFNTSIIACRPCLFIFVICILVSLYFFEDVTVEEMEEKGREYQIFELGEVVVTAEREVQENPTTIAEVTAEDIKKHNATNLGEALKLLPGVHFHQGRAKHGFYATVRGFEQDKVLILLDGVPIYEPYESLVDLSDIPVQNISKVKVVKGLSSSLYGPNTMGV